MLSHAEMREIMDAGLHNDTYFDKQDRERTRKEGYKVWGIGEDTAKPYIVERGFADEDEARAFIQTNQMQGRWFLKEADDSDPDYYSPDEKGFWAGLSDEEYDYYSEMSDRGSLY